LLVPFPDPSPTCHSNTSSVQPAIEQPNVERANALGSSDDEEPKEDPTCPEHDRRWDMGKVPSDAYASSGADPAEQCVPSSEAHRKQKAYCVSKPKTYLHCSNSRSDCDKMIDPRWDCDICGAKFLLIDTSPTCRKLLGIVEVAYHEGELVASRSPGECPRCRVQWHSTFHCTDSSTAQRGTASSSAQQSTSSSTAQQDTTFPPPKKIPRTTKSVSWSDHADPEQTPPSLPQGSRQVLRVEHF